MIGQYLSNTNESAIVSILQKILELNKALAWSLAAGAMWWRCSGSVTLSRGTTRRAGRWDFKAYLVDRRI